MIIASIISIVSGLNNAIKSSLLGEAIDNLAKDHTVIIVAHRLSTIIDADVINVIEKGKLVSYGTHDYLLDNSLEYKRLYTSESSNS